MGERIALAAESAELLRILHERGIRREWESSNRFFHSLLILSVSFQLFLILPLGAKRDLPLFSAVYRQFRIFPFQWHSKWHSTQAICQHPLPDFLGDIRPSERPRADVEMGTLVRFRGPPFCLRLPPSTPSSEHRPLLARTGRCRQTLRLTGRFRRGGLTTLPSSCQIFIEEFEAVSWLVLH